MKRILVVLIASLSLTAKAQEQGHLQGNPPGEEENAVLTAANTVQASVLEIEVFPNPSRGELTVEGKEGSVITVYSSSGIYVGTWMIGPEERVNLQDLSVGSYICSVENNGLRSLKRFVVL